MSYYTYLKYGEIVEITCIEKEPSKIRVYAPKARRSVYEPRRADSLRRAKQICVRRLLSGIEEFGVPLLFTLTFGGESGDAQFASDSLRRFQVRLRDVFPNAQSLFVPELSPRGRIHFHGLVFNVPVRFGDVKAGQRVISYGEERQTRLFAGLWGNGFVDCRQTDGSSRLAYYLAKYVTKAAGETLFNAMHLIRISQGFPREIYINTPFAQTLADRFSKYDHYSEWQGQNDFLGTINRKKYLLPLKEKNSLQSKRDTVGA